MRRIEDEDHPAAHADWENLMVRLENELADGGFFRTPEIRPTMVRNIRNMLSRGQMTAQEVQTFHGIIAALLGRKKQ